jgi:MFS family permease
MSANGQSPSLILPSRARFGVLGFACTLSLVTYLDRICIMRATTDIERDLGFGDTHMGWVFSAFLVGYLLFEIPGGWMGDRWGTRRTLTRIVLCWSLFTALTGCVWAFRLDSGLRLGLGSWQVPLVLDAFVLMLLVRFLFGVGEAGAYPNLARVVRDWFPFQERAGAQGGIWASARLGGALAPIVLGRLAAWLGWRQAFWVLGCIGVVWVCIFRLRFRDRPDLHPDCNEAERRLIAGGQRPGASTAQAHGWPSGRVLWSGLVTVSALCFASFWVCFGWYFYPTWQPRYLEDIHHYRADGWVSELLTGAPFLCGAVGALIGGGVSDRLVPVLGKRWGRSLVGLVGFSGAGLCVLGTGFVPSTWQAVTLLCLASLINDLAIPVIWATCADVGGRFTGTVSGVMNTAGGFGAILSPLLIPYVRDWLMASYPPRTYWRIIFAGLAGAWFLAAAAWLFINAGRRLGETADTAAGEPERPLPRTDEIRTVATGIRSQEAGVSKTLTPDS